MKSALRDFKAFVLKGDVVALAVAVNNVILRRHRRWRPADLLGQRRHRRLRHRLPPDALRPEGLTSVDPGPPARTCTSR